MDAVDYLKEYERMCGSFGNGCEVCGINKLRTGGEGCASIIKRYPKEVVTIVEKWSAEHPVKTRQSEFLKMFPDATVVNGHIDICPRYMDEKNPEYIYCYKMCEDCKKEYWLTEVE